MMRKHMVIQSISADPADLFIPYMDLQQPIHRQWAENMDADYWLFKGIFGTSHPTWNRFPMMLDLFDRGYEKVVWLDADTLVVKPDRSIFVETPDDVPLVMTRVVSSAVSVPWKDERFLDPTERTWDLYNDGVLVANRCPQSIEAITFAWSKRRAPQEPWHVQGGMWELNWLLDYVYDHPESVALLDFVWNWQPFGWAYTTNGDIVNPGPSMEDACLLAWHGHGPTKAWPGFKAAYDKYYGGRLCDG